MIICTRKHKTPWYEKNNQCRKKTHAYETKQHMHTKTKHMHSTNVYCVMLRSGSFSFVCTCILCFVSYACVFCFPYVCHLCVSYECGFCFSSACVLLFCMQVVCFVFAWFVFVCKCVFFCRQVNCFSYAGWVFFFYACLVLFRMINWRMIWRCMWIRIQTSAGRFYT